MKKQQINFIRKRPKPKHSPWVDSDRDGVINMHDCQPNNPKKQEVHKWADIKHEVVNKKYLYHKTELRHAKEILRTGKLRPSASGQFSMSEHHNPHVIFKTYKEPVTLVLEKKNISHLKKINYKEPQNLKYKSEKEWISPGGKIEGVLKGIIVNEKSVPSTLKDTEVGLTRNVHKSIPTRYITEKDMYKIKFKGKGHTQNT